MLTSTLIEPVITGITADLAVIVPEAFTLFALLAGVRLAIRTIASVL